MSTFFDPQSLEQFYDNNPDSIIFALLAAKLLASGQTEKAQKIAFAGVEKHPAYPFGHFVLGMCYHQMNDLQQAKYHLEISLAYDDKNPKAAELLTEICKKLELNESMKTYLAHFYLLDSFNSKADQAFHSGIQDSFDALGSFSEEAEQMEDAGYTLGEEMEKVFESELDVQSNLDVTENIDDIFGEDILKESPDSDATKDELDETLSKIDFLEFEDIPSSDDDKDTSETESSETSAQLSDAENEFLENLEVVDELQETAETEDNFSDVLDESILKETNEQSEKYGSKAADSWELEQESEAPELSPEDQEVLAELDEFFAEFDEPEEDTSDTTSSEDELEEFGKTLQSSEQSQTSDTQSQVSNTEDQFDFSKLVDELAEEDSDPQKPPSSFNDPKQSDYGGIDDTPKPGFSKPPIISSTYGEILISQGQLTQALSVFTKLLERDPDNKRFQKKVDQLKQMIAKQNQ
jgi:tetratricopeptide (TPR) repeat protein